MRAPATIYGRNHLLAFARDHGYSYTAAGLHQGESRRTPAHDQESSGFSLSTLAIAIVAALMLLLPDFAFGATWNQRTQLWERDTWGRSTTRWEQRNEDRNRLNRNERNFDRRDRQWNQQSWDDGELGQILGEMDVEEGRTLSVKFVGSWQQMEEGKLNYDRTYLRLEDSERRGRERTYSFHALNRGTTFLTYRMPGGERFSYRVHIW